MATVVEPLAMWQSILLAESRMDLRYVIPIAVFLGVIALFWFLIDFFTRDQRANAELRLDVMNEKMRGNTAAKKEGKAEFLNRALEKASPALSKHIQPQTVEERSKLKQRLSLGGSSEPLPGHQSHYSPWRFGFGRWIGIARHRFLIQCPSTFVAWGRDRILSARVDPEFHGIKTQEAGHPGTAGLLGPAGRER
jgi:hypothetical protein